MNLSYTYYDLRKHRIAPDDFADQLKLLGKTEAECEIFFGTSNWTLPGFAFNWLVSTTTMLKWTQKSLASGGSTVPAYHGGPPSHPSKL